MRELDAYASKVFGGDLAPYTVSSESDSESGKYLLKFSANQEIITRFAIICGDATHNLRTALDFVWYELTAADTTIPPHKIKFPVYPTRERLEGFIASRKGQKSIAGLSGKLLDTIKPYKGGNVIGDSIYALHQLDIRDKHRLLIPQVQVSHVWDPAAEDSASEDVLYEVNIINTFGVKDKHQGKLCASMIFGEGAEPVEGQPVTETLRRFETAVNVALIFLGDCG